MAGGAEQVAGDVDGVRHWHRLVVGPGVLLLAVGGMLGGCATTPPKVEQTAIARTEPTATTPAIRPTATPQTAADFTLPDQDGHDVSMRDLRGKVVLMDFLYLNCPTACPALTAQLTRVQHSLKDAGLIGRVELLSITIDPDRDTPQALKAFAQGVGADLGNWHFLRGTPAQTRIVANAYDIEYQQYAEGVFDHTAAVIVVDPEGTVRAWEPADFSGDWLDIIRHVL